MIHDADRARRAATSARMVIWNQGEYFCVGANLFVVVMAAGQKQWDGIREMVKGYQYATQRMKYARVPVVAAPYSMTLGGGLELCFGVRRGAGRGRDVLGPRRGRRRPDPRRRRHA